MNRKTFRNDGRTYDLREFAWASMGHLFNSFNVLDKVNIRITFEI